MDQQQNEQPLNYLVNYSNGLAQITRSYPALTEQQRVSIPIRKAHLADALATLSVFGPVTITEPPSFQLDKAGTLTFDTSNVNRDLATKLSGAKVELQERGGQAIKGRLVGIQQRTEVVRDNTVETYSVQVFEEGGTFRQLPEANIASFRFLDDAVNAEINAALDRSFRSIKPDSTYVDVSVAPDGEGSWYVQYVVPTSAWQSVYTLRQDDGGKWTLQYSAKVDNPTDEDWRNFIVTVVVGDPITFETDLNEIRCPRRQKVNIVSDQAVGAVAADEGYEDELPEMMLQAACASPESYSGVKSLMARGAYGSAGGSRSRGGVSAKRVQQDSAEASEVGDFAIFTTKTPVTILANRSGLVPLFELPVTAQTVLLYKERSDSRRPFRAVKFTNTTPHSLGKGVLTVDVKNAYAGTSVLEATKPSQERLQPHSRENGIRVWKNPPGHDCGRKTRRTRLEISKGVAVWDLAYTQDTVYRIKNNKPEDFDLEIEHDQLLGKKSRITITVNEKPLAAKPTVLESGWRIPVKLPAATPGKSDSGMIEVRVSEAAPDQTTVTLAGINGADWLQTNIINVEEFGGKVVRRLQPIIQLREAAQEALTRQNDLQAEAQRLAGTQARLMELTKNAKEGSQADEWRKQLAENEARIQAIEKTEAPAALKAFREAEAKLTEALKKLSLNWIEGDKPPAENGDGDREALAVAAV